MKKETRNVAIFIGVFVFLMALAYFVDSPLSKLMMNQNSVWATCFQDFGLFPVWLISFISLEVFAFASFKGDFSALIKGVLVVASLGAALFMMVMMWKDFLTYGYQWLHNVQAGQPIGVADNDGGSFHFPVWKEFVFGGLSFITGTIICYFWLRNKDSEQFRYLVMVGAGGICAVLLARMINDTAKDVWGRFRPYEIMGHVKGAHFTNWLTINGKTGHKSFPSGHSNTAFMILWLPMFVDRKNIALAKKVMIGCIMFGVLMMISRMRMGAHHLSDVTCGATITIVTIYVIWSLLRTYVLKDDEL
jgi:membrane-associated phospholipid phosphatase